jgi:hypothetical protein
MCLRPSRLVRQNLRRSTCPLGENFPSMRRGFRYRVPGLLPKYCSRYYIRSLTEPCCRDAQSALHSRNSDPYMYSDRQSGCSCQLPFERRPGQFRVISRDVHSARQRRQSGYYPTPLHTYTQRQRVTIRRASAPNGLPLVRVTVARRRQWPSQSLCPPLNISHTPRNASS